MSKNKRKEVWVALSDIFLDTDVTLFYDNIAKICAESGYLTSELKDILFYEVSPVCIWNLYDIAGEWAGFNEDWLIEEIEKRLKKSGRHNFLNRIKLNIFGPTSYLNKQWEVVEKLIKLKIVNEIRSKRSNTLDDVIRLFNLSQIYVLEKLMECGIPRPKSAKDWVEIRMNRTTVGKIQSMGLNVRPHGYGLSFKDDVVFIDFDFGENGELNGFDPHRLHGFMSGNGVKCDFSSVDEIKSKIAAGVECGEFNFSGYINYYRAEKLPPNESLHRTAK